MFSQNAKQVRLCPDCQKRARNKRKKRKHKPTTVVGASLFDQASNIGRSSLQEADESFEEARVMSSSKTFRDSIHGDIELREWEVAIVDTPEFQRLRGVKQLGLTHLVYPGAVHTRFEHSIGTVYMAQKIIYALNHGAEPKHRIIDDENTEVIRLVALLHDIGHLPYGHTLEKECNILDTEHDEWERLRHYIEEGTTIGSILVGKKYFKKVTSALKLLGDEKPDISIPPYITDIVGNTICADLLDYLQRDGYHCGLNLGYDDRIIRYFDIHKESQQMVVQLEKGGEFRRDNVSELIDLLRNRYSLAEKVLFHHTKLAATAMLARSFQLSGLTESDILLSGQEELLSRLANDDNAVVAELARRLQSRQIHKLMFRVAPDYTGLRDTRQRLAQMFNKAPEEREDMAKLLEDRFDMESGSICIYCPHEEMQFKSAEVQVIVGEGFEPRPLSELEEPAFAQDVRSLKSKHQALWSMCIFLSEDEYHKAVQVAEAFKEAMASRGLVVANDLDVRPSRRWKDAKLRSQIIERFAEDKDITISEKRHLQLELEKYVVPARGASDIQNYGKRCLEACEEWWRRRNQNEA